MTSRVLGPTEWYRLKGTEAEQVTPLFDPQTTQVLVIEDKDQIVGTVTLLRIWHAECLWIHPAYRKKGGVMRRLIYFMWTIAREVHAKGLWSGSLSDTTTDILQRLDGKVIPGTSFVFPVKE